MAHTTAIGRVAANSKAPLPSSELDVCTFNHLSRPHIMARLENAVSKNLADELAHFLSPLVFFILFSIYDGGNEDRNEETDVGGRCFQCRIFRDLLFFPRKCPGNFFREALSSDPGEEIALGALE